MKIKIKGVIVSNADKEIYDFFNIDAVSPNDIENQIETAKGKDIDIEINSGGGDVYASSEIYTMLKDYKGKKTVKVMSIAGSGASVIAMAGDTRLISPTAEIMIHNVSICGAYGDYRAMDKFSDALQVANTSIANAYILATGIEEREILEMMNKETWLTAQEAVKLGFATEIMFDKELRLSASLGSGLLPQSVIEKTRNEIRNKQNEDIRRVPIDLYKLKNKILERKMQDV